MEEKIEVSNVCIHIEFFCCMPTSGFELLSPYMFHLSKT